MPLEVTPARLQACWQLICRTAAAFDDLVQDVNFPLPEAERAAHAERLATIHDHLVRISNDVHLMIFHLGLERRIGPRGERRGS